MERISTNADLRGRTIVFLSFLEPWSLGKNIGAPSFFETLRGYCAAGATVHYVTHTKPGSGTVDHSIQVETDFPNLTVHRFDLPKLRLLANLPALRSKLYRLILFPVFAHRFLRKTGLNNAADMLYAYEQCAILACALVRRSSRKTPPPIVNRYQGTILGERYKDLIFAIRKLESFLVLRIRAHAYVMTDDGTLGDDALRYWNKRVNSGNLLFIRNGIDTAIGESREARTAIRQRLHIDESHIYLLVVCRLAAWKRVDRAIRLTAKLRKEFPNVRLGICGDGPQSGPLRELAETLGVDDIVTFHGPQPRDAVARHMHAADIFLSLYDVSNCGNPLLEAQLCGIPTITLNNGGTATVITDRVNGRIVEPLDEEVLRAAKELLSDPALREALSKGAVDWAQSNLISWDERIALEISWLQQRLPSLAAKAITDKAVST